MGSSPRSGWVVITHFIVSHFRMCGDIIAQWLFFSVLRCSSSHQSLGPVLVSLPKPSPTPKPQRCFACNQHIIKIIVDKIPKDFWHLRSLVVVNASPFYKEFLRMCVGANYPLFLSFAFCLSSAGTLKCLRVCVFIFAAERAKADSISCMYNFY